MKVSNSRVDFVQNVKVPAPLYYALYRWTPHGYERLFNQRNLPKDELLTYAADNPGTYRAYPRLNKDAHPAPRYRLVCVLSDGHKTIYKSTDWKYICRQFDRGVSLYNDMSIRDLLTGELLVQRDPDGTVTVSNNVVMPKHRPEPRYKVTIYEPRGLRRCSYTYAWKYAKRAFNKAVKVYDKADVIDLATGEVYMSRNGTDWYFSMSIATLQ